MSIVTCDVVEAAAAGANQMFVEIDFSADSIGFGRSAVVWTISAMLMASAVASDTAYLEPVGLLDDRAVAADAMLPQAQLNVLVVERARARDSLMRAAAADVIDTAAGGDVLALARTQSFADRANGADQFASTVSVSTILTSRAVARDGLLGFNDLDINDAATGHDVVFLASGYSASVLEAGLADDMLIVDGEFVDVVIERARGASFITSRVDAFTVAADAAVARDRLVFQMSAMAWVMNTESFAMARYTSLPFKSMAMVGGRVLGLGDAGLYELAGDTDMGEPIKARVVTGRSLLGTPAVKRIPAVYITGAVDGQLDLTAVVYGTHKGAFTYSMVARAGDAPRGHRVQLGRGLASVYWKFVLENKDGADFAIDTIKADVAASTTRRI